MHRNEETTRGQPQETARTGTDGARPEPQDPEAGTPESQSAGSEAQEQESRPDEAYLRLLADFENYKRHSRQQLERARAEGRDELVRALVPVLADLRNAISAEGRNVDEFREGVRMILERIEKILADFGYERIPTEGQPMDPRRHEAVATVDAGSAEPGTIVAEVSPGYTRSGSLVHPARVVVTSRSS